MSGNLIPQDEISYCALPVRGIRQESAQKYKYGVAKHNGKPVQVAQWFDASGICRVQKLRYEDKSFRILGDTKYMGLFGLHLWRNNGKRIFITEGEIDALTCYQALESWPVVSLPNGVSSAVKAIKADIERLEQYESVILCFDQDEAGQAAVEAVVPLFSPGKVKVATLPLKDANDMLTANPSRVGELVRCLFEAQDYRPEGIVTGDDLLTHALAVSSGDGKPYPWDDWQVFLRGRRQKELVLLTGGTGGGKSTVTRALAAHELQTGSTVGYIALEESVGESVLSIYGYMMGRRLRLEAVRPEAELKELNDQFKDRFFALNHFGSNKPEFLLAKLRYMVRALSCDVVFLDHVSIAISGLGLESERAAIDKLMTDLRSFAEETGVSLYVICHLRRDNGRPAEEGAEIGLHHLRGSQSLAQLSDVVLAFERNSQADDEEEKNTLRCRCLKNRPVGKTGLMGYLRYHEDTGLLTPTVAPGGPTDVFED